MVNCMLILRKSVVMVQEPVRNSMFCFAESFAVMVCCFIRLLAVTAITISNMDRSSFI